MMNKVVVGLLYQAQKRNAMPTVSDLNDGFPDHMFPHALFNLPHGKKFLSVRPK